MIEGGDGQDVGRGAEQSGSGILGDRDIDSAIGRSSMSSAFKALGALVFLFISNNAAAENRAVDSTANAPARSAPCPIGS